ncbi:MAG TPA: type II toxin-antitoxin system RelE/ParE family toxin [Azospirillum sp.]
MKIRYSRGARDQLLDISRHIREQSPDAATRVGQRLRDVIGRLAERPGMGAPGRVPGTREFKVPGLPYRIIYRVQIAGEPVLEVLRVHHEARQDAPPDWT